MQSDIDNDFLNYFTDVEHLRSAFREYVAASSLPKRLFVIHGVGGVGKSSLLRMYRIYCKGQKIPVGLASGDDTKSVLDLLRLWMEDLKEDGIKFVSLGKSLEKYRVVQVKVIEQLQKTQDMRKRLFDFASKSASKTGEAAGGAIVGAAIGSIIPGIGTTIGGTLGGVLGGMGVEALVDWLRFFLSKPDIDFLLDPSKKLTTDFLEDISKAAEKRRIVLMLDTFEQISGFDDWLRDVAQRINPNVLLVIAGRNVPDWNRIWQDWMAIARVEELKPMTEDVMRELIHRYYASLRGGTPNSVQVDAIIRFARGLPIAVTSAVQLWVKYGVEDFQSVKAEIVADIVDRLIEGVPSNLIPVLEAAAIVRWFDQPILRVITGLEDVRDVYAELRRFPFVRTRVEGLALHDSIREMMDENLRIQDSERHCGLHTRAAMYFEKRLEKMTDDQVERLERERLYHLVRADEEMGIKLFQELAEEFTRFRLINRLRELLNDVSTYPLQRENSKLWQAFYGARLADLNGRFIDAGTIYQSLGENKQAESKLKAYALCDWGKVLAQWDRLGQEGAAEKALTVCNHSMDLLPEGDVRRAENLFTIASIWSFLGNYEKGLEFIEQASKQYVQLGDNYGSILVYEELKGKWASKGNWKEMIRAQKLGLDELGKVKEIRFLKMRLLGSWGFGWIWAGMYKSAENNILQAIDIAKDMALSELQGLFRDLSLSVGLQERINEAMVHLKSDRKVLENLQSDTLRDWAVTHAFRGFLLTRNGQFEDGIKELQSSTEGLRKMNDVVGFPRSYFWLGLALEMAGQLDDSETAYAEAIKYHWTGVAYFVCGAFTALVRVKYKKGNYDAIPPLTIEAEQLAQKYEYNDHLASLRLTQGHIAWENGKKNEAFALYQKALIYSLRYNRFLLDELLSGRSKGTVLQPIIPFCIEHGEQGRKILVDLCDWWKSGNNDIGTQRPDTFSPILEGISLLGAEKIAREREPGDGSKQKNIIEQIEASLLKISAPPAGKGKEGEPKSD